LAFGLSRNVQEESTVGFRHFGCPFAWKATKHFEPKNSFKNPVMHIAQKFTVPLMTLASAWKATSKRSGPCQGLTKILLPLALLVPLGFIMDLVHELGHAAWGIVAGGRLAYLKVAYFELYPSFAVTPDFALGLTRVTGLTTEFGHGLFLLGGSATTSFAASLIGPLLMKVRLRRKALVVLRMLGLLGVSDLPLYVVLPQMGFRHWFFFGGETPEPLFGARRLGLPDPVFYTLVVATTLALLSLYSERLRGWAKRHLPTL